MSLNTSCLTSHIVCRAEVRLTIMQTHPCCLYPLTPHFNIVKFEWSGVYIFFLIIALNHRSWVHVRTASASSVYPQHMFRAKIRKISIFFHLKIIIFTVIKIAVYCIYMSLVRKPVFGVSTQVPHKPVCTATQDG